MRSWHSTLLGAALQLVQMLSGDKSSAEQQRRLAKEIAAENNILLNFPDSPREDHRVGCSLHDSSLFMPVL